MWNSRPPIRSESKRRHLFNKKNHRFDCKVNEIKENQSSCGFDFVSIRRFPGFLESRHPFVGWSSLFSFIFGKKKTMRNTRSHSVALIISESPICDKEICNQPTQCWFCWSLKHQTLFMMALVLFFLNWIIREPEASSIRMKFFLVKNGSWCWPIQTSSLQKKPSKLSLNWFFFHYKHADQIRWLKKPKELLATL